MSLLARFGKDRSGNVAILFSLALVPLLTAIGATIDYARASAARSALTAAIDSAALMAARDASRLTDGDLRRRAEAWVRANLQDGEVDLGTVAVAIDRTNRSVQITADGSIATSIMQIVGQERVTVGGEARSSWGTNLVELALVLDNTGSMGQAGKMDELKKATKALIEEMKQASQEKDQIRIAIVPFATQVRIDKGNKEAEWLRFGVKPTVSKPDWQGCITDRDAPNDVSDAGAGSDPATRYPAVQCKPGEAGLATIAPLTDNWDRLKAVVNAMTPGGNTNIPIGVSWGMAALSPGAPFTGAKFANTPGLTKYMILLTDGDNTENRFGGNRAAIDQKTKEACANAKAAKIKVYSIRVIAGNADLLRGCASEPSMYYDVKQASGIAPVIEAIAREISGVKLTH